MANFYGKNREEDFASTKLMSFGKSFSRMNGQPLDESEVWYNKTDLENFAKGNSAYVGMKLAYVDETNQKVYQYSVQYDGSIKEIGTAPVGDGKSVIVDGETGTVSLKDVDTLSFERDILDEDGQPTGQKESIQYQPLMTGNGLIWVEPSKTTVEGLNTLINGLDVRVKALEDKEDKDTTYSVKEGEKVLSLDGTAFGTTLKLAYNDNKIKLLGINDALISEFDASAFIADGMLEDASYDAATKKITFTWNIVIGENEDGSPKYKTDVIEIGDLVDTYTADNGISIDDNNKISIKLDTTPDHGTEYLVNTIDGLSDYPLQVKLQSVAQDISKKANSDDVYTVEETYNKSETDSAIQTQLTPVKNDLVTVTTQLAKTVQELWGISNPTEMSTSRIDTIETKLNTIAEGAQVNVIEAVEKANGAKLSVTKTDKTVTIDDSALVNLIDTAQSTANGASSAATANAGEIKILKETTIPNVKAIADKNAEDIAALTTKVAIEEGKVGTLETAVAGKVDQTTHNALAELVGTHTSDISGLKTRIAGAEADIDAILEEKANKDDVYTKKQIKEEILGYDPADFETSPIADVINFVAGGDLDELFPEGAVEEGKNLTNAILYNVGKVHDRLVQEETRATNAEGELSDRLDTVEDFFKAVETPDTVIDTLAEIVSYIESDKSGAASMLEAIGQNEKDIEALLIQVNEVIPSDIATALETAKKYTDDNMVKADGVTIKNTEGVFSVQKVTTDMIEQGENVLILNGGSANE